MSTVSSMISLAHIQMWWYHSIANIHDLCSSNQVQLQLTFLSYKPLSNYSFSGFAAEAPVSALQTLSTQDTQYKPNIEEDKVVNAYGDYAAAV